MTTKPRFLTKAAAAKTCSVSEDTILRAIRSGRLRAKRSGKDKDGNPTGLYLISEQALTDWFEQLEDA